MIAVNKLLPIKSRLQKIVEDIDDLIVKMDIENRQQPYNCELCMLQNRIIEMSVYVGEKKAACKSKSDCTGDLISENNLFCVCNH